MLIGLVSWILNIYERVAPSAADGSDPYPPVPKRVR